MGFHNVKNPDTNYGKIAGPLLLRDKNGPFAIAPIGFLHGAGRFLAHT